MAEDLDEQLDVPIREIVCSDFPEKIHMAKFGAWNETIVSVDGFGRIQKFDTETGKLLVNKEIHDGAVVCFDFDADVSLLLDYSICVCVLLTIQ
jgi:hypothetical protein